MLMNNLLNTKYNLFSLVIESRQDYIHQRNRMQKIYETNLKVKFNAYDISNDIHSTGYILT